MKAVRTQGFESLKRPETNRDIIVGDWENKFFHFRIKKITMPKGWVSIGADSMAVTRGE